VDRATTGILIIKSGCSERPRKEVLHVRGARRLLCLARGNLGGP
jgi:hypothetical protein